MTADDAAIHRQAAKRIVTAANIASGYGEEKLANQLWMFAVKLRRKAERKEEAARDDS